MKVKLLLLFLVCTQMLQAQNPANTEGGATIAKATEFAIPASPAFDLLGVNPSQIAKPSNIREFKVDWSFRSWRLKPNIALQAQPIWEIVYNKADLRAYQRASKFMKMLSTLDISAGTVEDEDFLRRASVAVKLNLYRQADPLRDAKLFESIDTSYRRLQWERMAMINEAHTFYKRNRDEKKRLYYENLRDSLESEYDKTATEQKARIQEIAQKYIKDNWNAAHVDIAYGKVFSYDHPRLDSLGLRGLADAVWLNGSVGIGNKMLITGLVRFTMQNERHNGTLKKDTIRNASGDVIDILKVKTSGNIFSAGASFRYGSPKFNFFAEYVYSVGDTPKAITDVNLNLTQLGFYSMSYGGDWRINRNIMLSYGVRIDYSEQFRFKNIIPVASIACMMR